MGLSDYERAGILLCELICNSFGLLGVLLIVILYLSYAQIRFFDFKLILFLSISTAGYSIGVLIGPSDTYTCALQATIISYFSLSSVIWMYLIPHSLYVSILSRRNPDSYLKKYLFFGYLFPIPITVIPGIVKAYSRTPLGLCWINTSSSGGKALVIWQIWIFIIGAIVYTAIVLFRLHQAIKVIKIENIENTFGLLKSFNRLKYFCFIVYLSETFALINIFYLLIDSENPSFGLCVLHIMFNGLQGVFCLGCFIRDHSVYELLIETFSGCMPCCLKKKKKNKKSFELNSRA